MKLAIIVTLLLTTLIPERARADVAKPSGDKEEEVDRAIEEVNLAALEETTVATEYERAPWLLVLPFLCALVVAWNVDWREARVKTEIATARLKRAHKPPAPADEKKGGGW